MSLLGGDPAAGRLFVLGGSLLQYGDPHGLLVQFHDIVTVNITTAFQKQAGHAINKFVVNFQGLVLPTPDDIGPNSLAFGNNLGLPFENLFNLIRRHFLYISASRELDSVQDNGVCGSIRGTGSLFG